MALPMKKVAMKAAMKAMKAKPMKAVKAMKKVKKVMKAKAMKKKAMKRSVIAKGKLAKVMVLHGFNVKTSGGLKKDNLKKNKEGRIVSKAASDRAKKAYAGSAIQKWNKAVQQAKKALNMSGMVFVGGKTAQGRALYAKAKVIYKA